MTAVPGVSLAVLQAAVVETETALQRLTARRAALLAAVQARGGGEVIDAGGRAVPTRFWLRDATGMTVGAARRALTVAEGLAALPAVRDAVADGSLRADRAEVLATHLVPHVPAAALAEAEAPLLAAARVCEPPALAARIRAWVADRLPEVFADREARVDRWLQVDPAGAGRWTVHGRLDALGAETLKTALAPLLGSEGTTDTRSTRTRRADALVALARHALDTADLPDTGGARPQISVVVTSSTLAGEPGAPTARGDHTGPLVRPHLLALACDADLHLTHLHPGTGQVVALHSVARTVPAGLRRALVARDGGCVHHACSAPAAACHAHHLHHWADGGATTIENLALLCARHHAAWHRGHLTRHDLRLPGDPAPPRTRAQLADHWARPCADPPRRPALAGAPPGPDDPF